MAKLVSKTYGEALFELALEENTLDNIVDEVEFLKSAFTENNDLLKLLNHPKISKEEKKSVVENIFKDKLSDSIVGFLTIIVEKDRYNEMEAIFDYFIGLVREHKQIGMAAVTSAVALTDAQKQQVEERLLQVTDYKQFIMDYQIDEKLIGGMVIRIGDRVVDSSIRTKIEMMSKSLSNIYIS